MKTFCQQIQRIIKHNPNNAYRQDISLEDSFVQYKKGMELLKVCNEKIDAIEKKVLILNGEGETDEF